MRPVQEDTMFVPNFEDYDRERFLVAIAERNEVRNGRTRALQTYHILPHQKAILDRLTVEREILEDPM